MSAKDMGILLDCVMEDFARLTPSEAAPDGLGGHTRTWTEAEIFRGFLRQERVAETAEGQRMTEAPVFLLVTPWDVELDYHDIVKRLSDGATYRMLSDTRNKKPPAVSAIHIAAARCERWELK